MRIVVKIAFALTLGTTFLSSCNNSSQLDTETKQSLPYLGFKDTEVRIENGTEIIDTLYHEIGPFYFTSHSGEAITNATVENKIYVADFFFTHCPTICPVMTENLKQFHKNTKDIDDLLIISHTIDPKRDSLARLAAYISERNLDLRDDWFFVRGSQSYTYDIGKDEYLINAQVDRAAEGGFLHSEHFVLIDKAGHIRGMYAGTDTTSVNQLEKDIRILIATEYDNK